MDQFGEKIVAINEEMMKNGTIEELIRSKLQDAYASAIKSAFQWGDLQRTIEKRVTEVLVPAVEKCDLSDYVTKLDDVLTEIVKNSALPEYNQLVTNFQTLMTKSVPQEIQLSNVMKVYRDFCARNLDCTGRKVDTDDEPTYECGNVIVYVEDRTSKYSNTPGERALLICDLDGDEEDENREKLHREIPLHHYSWDHKDGYAIDYDYTGKADITSLRTLDEFDVWLIALTRNGSRLLAEIGDNDEDSFIPEEEPSCDWT